METNSIKVLMKKEIEAEKEDLEAHIEKFKEQMELTKNVIVSEITGAKDTLIEDNAKLNENISKGINEV